MPISAIVVAGDRRAAKAIHGESKVYLELEGRPLVAHVVAALQRVPEIGEVWVVGDAARLETVLRADDLKSELCKPLHIVPQFRNLYENAWQTYRRLLAGPGSEGRDPVEAELDRQVLYLSADVPFATPQEISEFVRRGTDLRANYVIGLVTEESMEAFYPEAKGALGIRMAYVNLYEGRFRQSNLHLVQPGQITNRVYIEELYEHRYQKQFANILGLAWRILRVEEGSLRIVFYYLLMHSAAIADRAGFRRLADWMRRFTPLTRLEGALSKLLRTSLRFAVTDVGGCAVDIDNEHDYDAAVARYKEWRAMQERRGVELYGPLPLPERASGT